MPSDPCRCSLLPCAFCQGSGPGVPVQNYTLALSTLDLPWMPKTWTPNMCQVCREKLINKVTELIRVGVQHGLDRARTIAVERLKNE